MVATKDQIKGMLQGAVMAQDIPSDSPVREAVRKLEGTFECRTGCDKKFDRSQARAAHERSHTLVECEHCKGKFKSIGLGRHKASCAENPNRKRSEDEIKREKQRAWNKAYRDRKKAEREAAKALISGHSIEEIAPVVPKVEVVSTVSPILNDEDMLAMLEMLFPNGVPVHKLQAVSDWMALTKALLV